MSRCAVGAAATQRQTATANLQHLFELSKPSTAWRETGTHHQLRPAQSGRCSSMRAVGRAEKPIALAKRRRSLWRALANDRGTVSLALRSLASGVGWTVARTHPVNGMQPFTVFARHARVVVSQRDFGRCESQALRRQASVRHVRALAAIRVAPLRERGKVPRLSGRRRWCGNTHGRVRALTGAASPNRSKHSWASVQNRVSGAQTDATTPCDAETAAGEARGEGGGRRWGRSRTCVPLAVRRSRPPHSAAQLPVWAACPLVCARAAQTPAASASTRTIGGGGEGGGG